MSERRPLVKIAGVTRELPAGDTLPSSGGIPTTLQADYTIADYTQVISSRRMILAAGQRRIRGIDSALVRV